jgi:hypothetical protein
MTDYSANTNVDEMTTGVLTALAEVRTRLGSHPAAAMIVDRYAAEIIAEFGGGEDEG